MSSIGTVGEKLKSDNFYNSLFLNFIDQNLWLSTFFRTDWGPFNRSARLMTVYFSISLISLGNVLFPSQSLKTIQIGPIQFSPALIYISFIQGIIVAIPVYLMKTAFSKTVPFSMTKYDFYDLHSSALLR